MKNLSQKLLSFLEKSGHNDVDDIMFALSNVMVSLARTQYIDTQFLIDLINEIDNKQRDFECKTIN